MAAIVEVKYFNSFLLKKTMPTGATSTTSPVWNGSTGVPATNPTSGGYPVAQSTDQTIVGLLKNLELEQVITILILIMVLELI